MTAQPTVAQLVTPYLFPTGTWIYDQVRSLERYQALVVSSALENLERFPWHAIRTVAAAPESRRALATPAGAAGAARRMVELTRILRPCSVAHAHFGPEGFAALVPARLAGTPLVVSFYGYDLSQLPAKFPVWQRRYRRVFGAARAVLVEGNRMRATLLELGCPPATAIVQRLGIDLDAIPFGERRRREPGDPVRALVAASFREKKGIGVALEAVAICRDAGLEVGLTLIGEGPEEAAIEAQLARLGLDATVRRRPYVSHEELVREFERHDVLIQPSLTAADGDSEGGLPVTILEAAAAGMPILATVHCDIPDAVVDGRGGFLVAERDPRALAEALLELARRAEEWPAMGAFNRDRVRRLYALDAQARRLEEIYDAVRG